MILSLALSVVVAQALPTPDVSPFYLVAWVLVALVAGTPGVIAAVNTKKNREEIGAVRYEVSPNGGGSSFDLLHRLVWETHERTASIPDLVTRVEALEAHSCPYVPKGE